MHYKDTRVTSLFSDNPLFRRPTVPMAHCSGGPLFRRPIVPTAHYSNQLSLSIPHYTSS